jgi:hypothetical protein
MRGREVKQGVAYASGRPRVVVRVIIVKGLPLTTPPVELGGTIAIVVITAEGRRLGMSIPIWEVGLLVRRHGRLDLRFRLVVPFGTIVRLVGTGRNWRRESFIGSRVGKVGRILTEREWLLDGDWSERGNGGRAVCGLVP